MASYNRPSYREDFQIAVICALQLEYDAVSLLFDHFWDEDGEQYGRTRGDTNTYTTGLIGKYNAVLVLLSDIGKVSAASAAVNFRHSYPDLKLAFLVGTCGGVPKSGMKEVLLGDVVIGSAIVQYDLGKQYPSRFVCKDSNPIQQNKDVRSLVASFEAELGKERLQQKAIEHLKALQNAAISKKRRYTYQYPGPAEDKLFVATYRHIHRGSQSCHFCAEGISDFCERAAEASCAELNCDENQLVPRERLEGKSDLESDEIQYPEIFIGRIASGDTVMKSGERRDQIAREHNVIAFEMEGAGIWDELPCIIVKGICNYADSHKNKVWQPFAAATAASVMKALLERHALPSEPKCADNSGKRISHASPRKFGQDNRHHSDSNYIISLLEIFPTANGAAFNSRANEHSARCHPRTRILLLHQIKEWADNPESQCIFWLNGIAGTGKSTISLTIAHHFEAQGILGASFFFRRGEGDRGNANLFLTTLAAQLISKKRHMVQFVEKAINADPTIFSKALSEQFEKLIFQPLCHLNCDPDPLVVIVVDALDECDQENDIKLIIHLLSRLGALASVQMRIFITSRPELPIRLGFKKIQGQYQDVVLQQIPQQVIEDDISTYLRYELSRIRDQYNSDAYDDLQLSRDWPDENTIRILIERTVPLFISAATICRFVEGGSDPRSQLNEVLTYQAGNYNGNLDDMYHLILNQVDVGHTRLDEFRCIVGPIVLLAEPLSVLSLAQLLNIKLEIIASKLKYWHSVLMIPSKPHQPIRVFHQSFRDFLVDRTRCNRSRFCIDTVECHEMIATDCLRLMILGGYLKKDIYDSRKPGFVRTEVDAEKLATFLPAHLRYACLYWVYHLQQTNRRIQDGDQVHIFLKRHFLHWLEALSLLEGLSGSITMIDTLRGLAESGTTVELLLRDAKRFILNCVSTINVLPLQLYSSAVPFSPQNSVIRNLFKDETSRVISNLSNLDFDWTPCLQTLEGHNAEVNSVVFSHNSKCIASASNDCTVKIWDAITSRCLQTLRHSSSVTSVSFSHNGKQIVSISAAIKVWDVTTGECLQTFEGYKSTIHSIAWSDNAKYIILLDNDNTIKLWDAIGNQCLWTFRSHFKWINSVVFSNDKKWIASGSADNTVRIWEIATGECTKVLRGHEHYVNSVCFSDNAEWVVSTSCNETIKIWDVTTGRCLQTLKGHYGWVNSAIFSNDMKHVISASSDSTIKIWDAATGQCLQTLKGHQFAVISVAMSYDGNRVASASCDYSIKVWEITRGRHQKVPEAHDFPVNCVRLSSDQLLAASASGDCSVKIWEVATGKCKHTLQGHDKWVNTVCFSHDAKLVASTSGDCTVKIWDIAIGKCKRTLQGHGFSVKSAVFSFDDQYIASASNDGVKVWNVTNGKCRQTLKGHSSSINSVAFLHNSKWIASASDDCTVKIWDITKGRCLKTLEGHAGYVKSVALSHNGKLVASASEDKTIKIWESIQGTCLQTLDIGRTLSYLSFDTTNVALYSDVGTINLDTPLTSDLVESRATAPQAPRRHGYGISSDNTWIILGTENLVYLPWEYRPSCSTVTGSTVVIGCASGRVLIMRFLGDHSFT